MKLTMADVKRRNKEAGYFFFSPGTMKFFACRIESELIRGKYFITSEKAGFETAKRGYNVRVFDSETGAVANAGQFNGFKTKEEAKEYIKELA